MAVTRHEFLQALHAKLKPKVYLEIGVQLGTSLVLAEHSEMAVGVDPKPLITMTANQRPNQFIFAMTSDEFFEKRSFVLPPVDLAFIDGMHLVEYVLRDFLNVQKFMRPGGTIVFDDVLPYNDPIAARVEPRGGDWTGDVWKIFYILQDAYHLEPILVDTFPTGTMILPHVEPRPSFLELHQGFIRDWMEDTAVPMPILDRVDAVHPHKVLEEI